MQEELLRILNLKQTEECMFQGQSKDIGSPSVFGGQVLAQALNAARRTVTPDRFVHSLHAYFILRGDVNIPIEYKVETIRDGRSFTTRRVTAIQKNRAIFVLAASFQIREEGLEHQLEMPNIPPPESLQSYAELAKKYFGENAGDLFWLVSPERPIDFRPVELIDPFTPGKRSPFRHVWFKYTGELDNSETNQHLHREILAYASDFNLLISALLPHDLSMFDQRLQIASLDHAMWFHHDIKADDWLLMAIDSPNASGARGFARSNIFDKQGKLVASVTQEGLIRLREGK